MTAVTYDVFPIPIPAANDHLRSYKRLRLTSLKLDPESFSSSHERESKFTDEIWRERVDNSKKVSVISQLKGKDTSRSEQGSNTQEGPWVGLATALSPEILQGLGYSPPKSVEGCLVYGLHGVWVHPEHRRRGLAKRLHQATVEWIKEDKGRADEKKILLVQLKTDNIAAYSLYRSLGYREIVDEVADAGIISLALDI